MSGIGTMVNVHYLCIIQYAFAIMYIYIFHVLTSIYSFNYLLVLSGSQHFNYCHLRLKPSSVQSEDINNLTVITFGN